jgi:general secretion pathway protein G
VFLTHPNRLRSKQKAFTLVEVMVVVVILSILAAFVVPNVMKNPGKARIAKAKGDIRAIQSALDMYRLDNYRYPSTDQGLQALVSKPADAPNWQQGGYLSSSKVPKDPWDRNYLYMSPGTKGGEIDVYTLGRDGQAGGQEEDADIGNWTE